MNNNKAMTKQEVISKVLDILHEEQVHILDMEDHKEINSYMNFFPSLKYYGFTMFKGKVNRYVYYYMLDVEED